MCNWVPKDKFDFDVSIRQCLLSAGTSKSNSMLGTFSDKCSRRFNLVVTTNHWPYSENTWLIFEQLLRLTRSETAAYGWFSCNGPHMKPCVPSLNPYGILNLNGISLALELTGSLCVCSCLARSDELENFLLQLNSTANLQLNGFCPVWDRTWIFRFSDRANARWQFSNWNGSRREAVAQR